MSTKVKVLVETQYFPPIAVFSLLKNENTALVIEQCENYQKRSYRNKCLIAASNGPFPLTVPLLSGKNAQQIIKDVRIANSEQWQRVHWQAIRSSYGKSPYFEHYAPYLEPIFTKKHDFLFDLNHQITSLLLKLLKLQAKIEFSETYCLNYEGNSDIVDFRDGYKILSQLNSNKKYPQVFEDRHGFIPGLSILDLLFCMGPNSKLFL